MEHRADPRLHVSSRAIADPPLITELLVARATATPDQLYMTEIAPDGKPTPLTFGALEDRSARLAVYLARHHGVTKGARVALIPLNTVHSVVAIYALMRMGAVTLMLNPTDPPARQAELSGRAGTILQLRDPLIAPGNALDCQPLPDASEADRSHYRDPVIDRWADVFFIGTSGSTAASKIVRQMHANAASNAADTIHHHRMGPGQKFLGCLPINHVNGLHFTLFATLAAGMEMVLLRSFQPLVYPQVMQKVRPRIASVAPSLLDAQAKVWRDDPLPGWFDYFVSAAAPLTVETARAVHAKLGARIVQSYGLTETTNFSCAMPTGIGAEAYRGYMLSEEIPPVGLPVTNEVAVLDHATGAPVAAGETGEVSMRGPNVMAGYLDNDAANDDALRDGWFRSGDLGYQISQPEGPPLTVLKGRIKNIAKVRGTTVSLEEIDRVLRTIPGLVDGACVAVPHPLEGEQIVVAVAASDDLSDAAITDAMAALLPPEALPRRFLRMEKLPRTATGKIRRPDLAREIAAR